MIYVTKYFGILKSPICNIICYEYTLQHHSHIGIPEPLKMRTYRKCLKLQIKNTKQIDNFKNTHKFKTCKFNLPMTCRGKRSIMLYIIRKTILLLLFKTIIKMAMN